MMNNNRRWIVEDKIVEDDRISMNSRTDDGDSNGVEQVCVMMNINKKNVN